MRAAHATWLCLLLLSSTSPGLAETNPPPSSEKPASPAPAAEPSKHDTNEHPGANEGTPAVVVDENKVQSLLGRDVKSASGEKLGQITDVIVGRAGDVRAAVIDFGGFLGVGTRKMAVAWSALRFSPDSIIVDMTRDELRVTPEYRPGEPIVIVGPQSAKTTNPPPAAVKPPAAK